MRSPTLAFEEKSGSSTKKTLAERLIELGAIKRDKPITPDHPYYSRAYNFDSEDYIKNKKK